MPELDFSVVGAEPVYRGITPLLRFCIKVTNPRPGETIQALILQAQIQFQPAQRHYTAMEKEKLRELFGPPQEWGRTVRNRLWCHASTTTGTFSDSTEVSLMTPCSYDLNSAATKFLYALEEHEVPLLFLFSGSIFYLLESGRLQVQPISWESEATYRMPVEVWHKLMESHFPNSASLTLRRDVFERLASFKRNRGFATWEQTLETLLEPNEENDSRQAIDLVRIEPTAVSAEAVVRVNDSEVTT